MIVAATELTDANNSSRRDNAIRIYNMFYALLSPDNHLSLTHQKH